MKTLNEQYRLIKEDKGHKGMFLTEAKRQFPNYIRNAATFDEAEKVLKQKGVITENFSGLEPINSPFSTKIQQPYEAAFAKFIEEAKSPEIKAKEVKAKTVKSQEETEKAELKKPSDQVEDDLEHMYNNVDDKNIDNLIFDQVMTGYYAEMKDPKNADKTMEQLKDIVLKNLAKDPIFYTKDGQFGVKGLGYTTEAPGLGTPKEAKGKYKASGYGDLSEGQVDMDKSYPKIQNPGTKITYKGKSGEITGNFMVGGEEFASYKVKFDDGTTDEISTADENIKFLEEAYQLVNINLKGANKDREERDPTDKYLTFDKDFEKDQRRKGNLIVKDGDRIFITKVLHANLGPKAGNAYLRKHLMDRANIEPAVLGGQQVWKIKGAKINSKGNISVFVPVEKTEMGEGKIGKNYPDALSGEYEGKSVLTPGADLYDLLKDTLEIAISEDDFVNKITYALTDETSNISSQDEHKLRTWYEKNTENEDMNIQETRLRRAISTIIHEELAKKPLNENVDKRLKEIEAEAAMEAMGSKMEKIMAEIEKRQSQLSRLDEDEDLKAMMDKKATSKIQKEIKLLERAKAKVEKIMGKGKGKKVEVIDEMEDAEENPEFEKAAARAEEMYNGGLEIKDILVKFNPRMRNDLERHLRMGFEGSDND
jgi:hypothetical protein